MRTIPVMQGDTLLDAVRAASRAGTYDKHTKTLHIPFAAWVRVIDAAAAEETREPEGAQTMSAFEWSTNRPTCEGWWWMRWHENTEPEIVQLEDVDGSLWADDGDFAVDEVGEEVEWAGPIQVPTRRVVQDRLVF